jgi:ABC-type Fe3+/spermidine/putrescine transport system ATPase subunit
MTASSGTIVRVEGLSKRYGDSWAVRGIDFEVYQGEILVLLGPSGCGKSTTLRMLAGLERPDRGAIYLKEKTIVHTDKGLFLPSEKRNMGMVFQSFAIWPHLTVEEHVTFPLKVRGVFKKEARQKVRDALAFVNLQGFETRLATQLSGGQQQRLALARALVYEPDVLLLDEPLSNLDAKLREQMRTELKKLQEQLGTTLIFVTHDQVEAMTLAHRIALMKNGRFEQIGTPEELYDRPATSFVHSFLGTTIAFEAEYSRDTVGPYVEPRGGGKLRPQILSADGLDPRSRVLVTVRPNDLRLVLDKSVPDDNEIAAVVENIIYLGECYEIAMSGSGAQFSLQVSSPVRLSKNQKVVVGINHRAIKLWPA